MRSLLVLLASVALSLGACEKKADGMMSAKEFAEAAARNEGEARAFLGENIAKPGVMSLPSGVQYKVLKSGPASGPTPKLTDQVRVNYEGALLNGKVFDSTYKEGGAQPQVFPLNGLIEAWGEALQKMRPGDEWTLYVPPEKGYGREGAPPDIPPNSLLVFKINLVDVLPAS